MLLSRLPAPELSPSAEPPPVPDASNTRVPWHGGWAAVPHTATRSALPNNAYRVLGLLIGHMDLTTCEVHGYSAQRLANELGWSTRTVERALATLRTAGWVSAYPDPAPYRLGWLVYVVRQEECAPRSELSVGVRQTCWGVPTQLTVGVRQLCQYMIKIQNQIPDQKETPAAVGASILSEMTVIPLGKSERRHERRRPTDKTDAPPSTKLSEPPAIVVAADVPPEVTATEQLLLDTGFHPTTAHAFSSFDYDAVWSELHKQDLLGWLPREDRDRRIGMLVMRWRRVKPEAVREREMETSQETAATRYALREETPTLVQHEPEALELCEEAPLDPWTERARRLRPQWTSEQQSALARSLRHAPNDAAALVMAQVTLGVAQRC